MATPTVAANAYASLARMMDSGGAEKGGQTSGGQSFSALLKDAVGSVLEAGKKSDAQTMAMTSGKANVMDVVTHLRIHTPDRGYGFRACAKGRIPE